jgi:hypothetical protein
LESGYLVLVESSGSPKEVALTEHSILAEKYSEVLQYALASASIPSAMSLVPLGAAK